MKLSTRARYTLFPQILFTISTCIFFDLGVLVTWYSIRLKFRELCKTASSILITALLWRAHCARLSGDACWEFQEVSHGLYRYIHSIHGVPNCFQKIINAKRDKQCTIHSRDMTKTLRLNGCEACVVPAWSQQSTNRNRTPLYGAEFGLLPHIW